VEAVKASAVEHGDGIGTTGAGAHGAAERVLVAADRFCWDDHWMMNIGDEKGKVLDEALRERIEVVQGQRREPSFSALELGTYVGYSTVRIGRLLPAGATLYTCDPHDAARSLAQEVVELAGLSERVRFLAGTAQACIRELGGARLPPLDLVFIDHEKGDYLPALRALEAAGLLGRGTTVVADNVDVFRIDDYLGYVRGSGRYRSRHFGAALEYTPRDAEGLPEVHDGVEVSVFAAPEGAGSEL